MEWGAVYATAVTTSNQFTSCIFNGIINAPLTAPQSIGTCINQYVISSQNPIVSVTSTVLLLTLIHFVLGLTTGNSSWVDKSWSILPAYYTWKLWLGAPGPAQDPRAAIIAAIIAVWGLRLTYNFYRKGGYTWAGEDYRWPIVRAFFKANCGPFHHILYIIFDLVFICFIQNALLASIVAPVYVALYGVRKPAPLNIIDVVAIIVTVALIITESIADEQQWNFQNEKYAKIATGKPVPAEYYKGFITSGLWKYSRHPNFFCEQSIWWSMSLFTAAATGSLVGWWTVPALMLSLLFQGSTKLTEDITASKYALYKRYQESTSRLVPWFPGSPITTQEIIDAAQQFNAAYFKALEQRKEQEDDSEAEEEEEEVVVKAKKNNRRRRSKASTAEKAAAAPSASPAPAKGRRSTSSTRGRGRKKKEAVVVEEVEDEEVVVAAPAGSSRRGGRGGSKRAIKPTQKAIEIFDEEDEEVAVVARGRSRRGGRK